MRAILLASLVVAALGVGLWFLIVRDQDAEAVPDKPAAAKKDEPAPAASTPTGEIQPRKPGAKLGDEIKKSIARSGSATPAPSLADQAAAEGSAKKAATPADHMRWALMRAVHETEPAIIDCLNEAKKTGGSVDGVSSYGVFLAKRDGQIVYDGSTFEYGPYSQELNTCIQNSAKTMTVEALPDNAERIKVFRKVTVTNGEIQNLQMPGVHVVDADAK